jgi:hypothetical protein
VSSVGTEALLPPYPAPLQLCPACSKGATSWTPRGHNNRGMERRRRGVPSATAFRSHKRIHSTVDGHHDEESPFPSPKFISPSVSPIHCSFTPHPSIAPLIRVPLPVSTHLIGIPDKNSLPLDCFSNTRQQHPSGSIRALALLL